MTDSAYYGIGPGVLQNDDEVCVILGADVPFVVRRNGSSYILLENAMFMGSCRVRLIAHGGLGSWRRRTFCCDDLGQNLFSLKLEGIPSNISCSWMSDLN